eukprot:TRINITY_DN3363_c0_g1_i1.p1 TRINITY_DN3363_c0_g1~~TRINITY_DN3363_c0_g1_i1.p1  ORF type:complete len:208 (-),score=39.18 TRINITY_DN3363_c0_g1_i1:27-650(-)
MSNNNMKAAIAKRAQQEGSIRKQMTDNHRQGSASQIQSKPTHSATLSQRSASQPASLVHKPTPTPVHRPAQTPVHRPAPTPVHRPAPTPVHRPAPAPVVHRPAPVVHRPTPAPVVHRPAPVVHRPTPTPVVHRPAPAVHRPTPVAHRPAPTPVKQTTSTKSSTFKLGPINITKHAAPATQTRTVTTISKGPGGTTRTTTKTTTVRRT